MQQRCASRKMWNLTHMTNKQPGSSSSQKRLHHQKQSSKVKSLFFSEIHSDGMFVDSTRCLLCFSTHPLAPNVLPSSCRRQLENEISSRWMNGLESTWTSARAVSVSVLEQNVHKDMPNQQKGQTVCSREGGLYGNALAVPLWCPVNASGYYRQLKQ